MVISMWIRKSKSQIKADRPNLWRSFSGPLLWFFIFFVLGFLKVEMVPPAINPQIPIPATWQVALRASLFGAGLVALTVYVLQLIVGQRLGPFDLGSKCVICVACHRVMRPLREGKCVCGGEVEDFDNWAWTDDRSDSGAPGDQDAL
jgi:hypothetical protein